MKLDIGCGNFPTGDVNTDLFIEDIGHRTGTAKHLAPSLAAQKIKNFVPLLAPLIMGVIGMVIIELLCKKQR